ncbi:TonB-dependent receptor [Asticcacaulis sp. SL142]|uniref:TonB-dependent receptor n=1 Tax=Asticcacaulis sp. SL142 TaxID=2995155 RepID=UPI00226CF3B3|nr:TonB-dependent receptor [Asticcacaulis sp. SL142]WAC49183.1 TonB-dependent receptor [Asticcacaulis sp. SL142]
MPNLSQRHKTIKAALMSATVLTALSGAGAYAQNADVPVAAEEDDTTVVVVTGYRASLRSATNAKKNATNFTETIFSEDLGKFPDLNMAESMQRVPGMVVQRDALSGEGTQVSVRALPGSFTQVTMNGNRVMVASDFGFTGSSPNRSVDLDMFPTGLFNRVDVSKTPSAETLEGGIAGTVNVQNARPFDRKGTHIVLAAQGNYNTSIEEMAPRFTGVFSKTWDKFGILAGYTQTDRKIYTAGFETIGWGDPNLANFCTSCDPAAQFPGGGAVVNPGGSNQFRFSNTVYGYTGNGLTPGALDLNGLLALNPGLTTDQIKGAILPRLGRNSILDGETTNKVGLIALEFRPEDNLRFTLDILGGQAEREALRANMMWAIRGTGPGDDYNGGMIPINMEVDSNNVVTSGTFANSSFFSESNFYLDETSYISVNAGFVWNPSDTWVIDGQVGRMESEFERRTLYLKYRSPFQVETTTTYVNDGGNDIPTIQSSLDLNDPTIGWRTFTSQMTLQRDMREVETSAIRLNATKFLGDWTIKGGWATDKFVREMDIRDNSEALRTAYTAAIPDSSLSNYMTPMSRSVYEGTGVSGAGFDKWVIPDFNKISTAVNLNALVAAPGNVTTGNSSNGAGSTNIEEDITSSFLMASYDGTLFTVPIRSNFGYRLQKTEQTITSPSIINNQVVYITTDRKYEDALPAFNVVAKATEKLNIRFAASKTMTRANPSDMSSQLGFSDPSAQSASQGNPNLKPYYSKNLDIGGEYYTGDTGYVGFTWFRKEIENYTSRVNIQVPFSTLGIGYENISPTQQTSMAVNLGTTVAALTANPSLADSAVITLSTPQNSDLKLVLTGQEFIWVQPLDNLLDGLGYTFNYTQFDFDQANLATGIPEYTYNLTGYYEHDAYSVRVSYSKVGETTTGLLPSPNSMPYNWYGAERHQIDMSGAYKFKAFGFDQTLTLDVTNVDNQGFKSYIGFENVPYGYQRPGTTILFGWRAQY